MAILNEEDLEILKRSPIFRGIHREQLSKVIRGLQYRIGEFAKGEVIFSEDDETESVMILLSGSLTLASDTVSGKRIVLGIADKPGELFGEIYSFVGLKNYDMYGVADAPTRVIFISSEIVKPNQDCSTGDCARFQQQVRDNLLRVFAIKAYSMNRRLRILGGGSIREKIVRYIFENHLKGDYVVTPTREALADYLNVTRPSLSRELGNMAEQGLIRLEGRKIYIVRQDELEEYL